MSPCEKEVKAFGVAHPIHPHIIVEAGVVFHPAMDSVHIPKTNVAI